MPPTIGRMEHRASQAIRVVVAAPFKDVVELHAKISDYADEIDVIGVVSTSSSIVEQTQVLGAEVLVLSEDLAADPAAVGRRLATASPRTRLVLLVRDRGGLAPDAAVAVHRDASAAELYAAIVVAAGRLRGQPVAAAPGRGTAAPRWFWEGQPPEGAADTPGDTGATAIAEAAPTNGSPPLATTAADPGASTWPPPWLHIDIDEDEVTPAVRVKQAAPAPAAATPVAAPADVAARAPAAPAAAAAVPAAPSPATPGWAARAPAAPAPTFAAEAPASVAPAPPSPGFADPTPDTDVQEADGFDLAFPSATPVPSPPMRDEPAAVPAPEPAAAAAASAATPAPDAGWSPVTRPLVDVTPLITSPAAPAPAATPVPVLPRHEEPATPPVAAAAPVAEAVAVEEPIAEQPRTRTRRAGRTKADTLLVFSGKGGVGKSVVATNLAVALSAKGAKVALVDLNLQYGDVAVLLHVEGHPTSIEFLAQQGEQVDRDYLDEVMATGPEGVRVLLAPASPEFADLVTATSMRSILRELSRGYDYVVVDSPAHLEERVLEAMEVADQVLVVSSFNITSVKDTRVTLRLLQSLGVERDRIAVVLNQTQPKVGFTTAEIEKSLRFQVLAQLPYDAHVNDAVDTGRPLVLSQPRSDFAKNFRAVVDFIAVQEEAVAADGGGGETPRQAVKRRLFGRPGSRS